MTRHFVLGNGTILVGLDKEGQLRDFYFPFVGQENHVNGKVHRFGVWVNGKFSWFSSSEWEKTRAYQKETLIADIKGKHAEFGVELHVESFVLPKNNVFLRKVTVHNLTNEKKEVRLFFHQQFDISEANVGDTVYYNPLVKSLVHYKGKRYFLMNGAVGKNGIAEYATGLVGEYGLEGTYKDAEDGQLSNNPVEHGSVDSTLGLHMSVPGKKQSVAWYWICAGDCFSDVSHLNTYVQKQTPDALQKRTEKHWQVWVNKIKFKYPGLSNEVVDLFKRSLLIINTQVDKGGSIIASSDSDMLHLRRDTYAYMWPRDGALIARSLDRAGYNEITEHFFRFCSRALTKEGYLFHKYRPDGSLGSSWHSWLKHGHIQLPIQEDQIALVLDAFWKHFQQHNNIEAVKPLFDSFIRRSADFMLSFMDAKTGLPNESYDLWEEKLGIHTFTCATVYAGFQAAAKFEQVFGTKLRERKYLAAAEKVKKAILKYLYDEELGYFIKGVLYQDNKIVRDTTLDLSSSYGVFQFGVLDSSDKRVESSMNICRERLRCPTEVGGYARYENDYYYRIDQNIPGNPWFITTLWLAEYYIHKAHNKKTLQPAIDIFNWVASHQLDTGVLSEQLHPHTGDPVSVAPLTWSHAGFVIAINKYLERLDSLGVCKMCNPPKFKDEKIKEGQRT